MEQKAQICFRFISFYSTEHEHQDTQYKDINTQDM